MTWKIIPSKYNAELKAQMAAKDPYGYIVEGHQFPNNYMEPAESWFNQKCARCGIPRKLLIGTRPILKSRICTEIVLTLVHDS